VPVRWDNPVATPAVGSFQKQACDLARVASNNIEELSGATSDVPGDVNGLIHNTSPDNGGKRGDARRQASWGFPSPGLPTMAKP